jgi:hypothetical protein
LLFREAWRLPAHTGEPNDDNRRVTPEVVANPGLELKLYGQDSQAVAAWEHEGRVDLWTGMATSPVAVTLRNRSHYVALTGLARPHGPVDGRRRWSCSRPPSSADVARSDYQFNGNLMA